METAGSVCDIPGSLCMREGIVVVLCDFYFFPLSPFHLVTSTMSLIFLIKYNDSQKSSTVTIPPKFCEHGFDFVAVIRSQFRFPDLFL